MSIKVTFEIPTLSPVEPGQLRNRAFATDDLPEVQDRIIEAFLALGFKSPMAKFGRCRLTLRTFVLLMDGDTHLATAILGPYKVTIKRL